MPDHDDIVALQAEVQRLTEALRASETQLHAILDHSPSAIILFDLAGRIQFWSAAAERIYGWTAAEVLGQTLPTVPAERDSERRAFQERVIAGQSIFFTTVRRLRKDGTPIEVSLSVAPLRNAAGEIYAQMSITADISEQVQAQAELVERALRLAAMEERERLSRGLHDGLGQTLGYLSVEAQAVELLLMQGDASAALANLRRMAQVAQDTHADLRGHILGLRAPVPVGANLCDMLESALSEFGAASGLVARFSAPVGQPGLGLAPAVEEQVLRIMHEALANVGKHAGARQVELFIAMTAEQVQLRLADDGRGFDPAQLPAPGPGWEHFGLSIMRERAGQIGAQLEVRSEPGHGAQVVLSVPRLPAWPGAEKDLARQVRVLLVDDHPLFLDGLRGLLQARGVTVVGLAHDGEAAQAQARALRPDVVLMDVQMPGCDGLEATRRLMAEFPDLKVVVLTTSESEEDLLAALRSGARGYLLKSLDANALVRMLAGVMQGQVPLPPALAGRVLAAMARYPAGRRARATDAALSPRQWEVLERVAAGKVYKEIAADLNIGEKTVKYHMAQILECLHLQTRQEAIAYARRMRG